MVTILGGQVQAKAIGFNIWLQKQQNARSSLYFEISGKCLHLRYSPITSTSKQTKQAYLYVDTPRINVLEQIS